MASARERSLRFRAAAMSWWTWAGEYRYGVTPLVAAADQAFGDRLGGGGVGCPEPR